MSTTLSSPSASATSSVPPPAASTSPPAGAGGGGTGPTSSPLLFFVALGFGVVFTNLWIIVGVKYCFRYNQRNRRAQQDENGEPIDMTAMPRAHRRRREKKLMSMDEVNERFPLMKYKAWMTNRAEEGLPTAGGIVVPSESRAASMRNVEGVIPPIDAGLGQGLITSVAKEGSDDRSKIPSESEQVAAGTVVAAPVHEPTLSSPIGNEARTEQEATGLPVVEPVVTATSHAPTDEDLDDDDHIQMAVPTEMMENPGDSCAICLDTLESDDDVRGLTCGHAFHASCLDPWLTSRRACCPLCKADYYIPKPRPEGDVAATTVLDDAGRLARRPMAGQPNTPNTPQFAFLGGRPRMLFPVRFHAHRNDDHPSMRYGFAISHSRPRPSRQQRNQRITTTPPAPATTSPEIHAPPSNTWRSRMRSLVPSRPNMGRHPRRDNDANEANAAPDAAVVNHTSATAVTPGQLEAGQA